MTRDELQKSAAGRLERTGRLICQWATGTGKSGVVLKFLQAHPDMQCLIQVPEQNNIQNWLDEFEKFHVPCDNVWIACYASFHKYENTVWDLLVFDECFRGDTEVLTNEGFKRFDALRQNEKIAQYNDDGTIEFVRPLRYIKRPHHGEMCKLSLATGRKQRCCYMTPNHQQVYRTKSMSTYATKSICDIPLNSYNYVPVTGKGKYDDEKDLSVLERLVIAVQADGSLDREQSDCFVYRMQVTKERKQERLLHLLQEYGRDNWTKQVAWKPGSLRVRIKLPKRNAKLLSSYFTPEISYEKARTFIDEIMEWDGSDKLAGNTRYYSSIIKENADLVAAIAVQAGYKVLCSVEKDERKESYSDVYRVYINPSQEVSTQSFRKEYIPYDGDVYCVEVPSHKIIVRSEGYVFVSGNCPHTDTEKRLAICNSVKGSYVLALGAVIDEDERQSLESVYGFFDKSVVNLEKAISLGFLPPPTVIVMHLVLDDTEYKYKRNGRMFTAKQRYMQIQKRVDDTVNLYRTSPSEYVKRQMFSAGLDRKRFLGKLKEDAVTRLCEALERKKARFLCFCPSIDQAERIGGDHAFTSKTPASMKLLEKFNSHEIDSLYVVGKLIEGQNLNDIQVGVISQLGGTQRITVQSIGRIMRSPNPLIYVPVFDGTKDADFLRTLTDSIPNEYIKHYNYK